MEGSQVDFAASDPPFRDGEDELADTGAEIPQYGYSYVPDVGGGTAFMYHLTVGGHLVTNLRLSGETLTKIFTGQITNWDDPEITKDYGAQLPNEPIMPVVRSDGSGATYFFTRWMDHEYPSQWNAFCQQAHPGIKPPARDRVRSAVRQREAGVRVQRGLRLRHLELWRGSDRLRRVRLRAERALAGRRDGEPGRLLRAAAGASNVAVALTQAQINRTRPHQLPPAGPGQRVHVHRPAQLPAVQLQLPDRAADGNEGAADLQHRRWRGRCPLTSTSTCARASSRPGASATRRCRLTSCRARSSR